MLSQTRSCEGALSICTAWRYGLTQAADVTYTSCYSRYDSPYQVMIPPPYLSASPLIAVTSPLTFLNAVRGKPRRGMLRRAVFSDTQRKGLERMFLRQKYISKPDRKKMASKLGLKDSQVKIWFQNRRMKWRNSKERELLSAGGTNKSYTCMVSSNVTGMNRAHSEFNKTC